MSDETRAKRTAAEMTKIHYALMPEDVSSCEDCSAGYPDPGICLHLGPNECPLGPEYWHKTDLVHYQFDPRAVKTVTKGEPPDVPSHVHSAKEMWEKIVKDAFKPYELPEEADSE